MNMALQALQGMAERGNRYIQACHALLTRIMGSQKSNKTMANSIYPTSEPMGSSNEFGQQQLQQHLLQPPQQSQQSQQPQQPQQSRHQQQANVTIHQSPLSGDACLFSQAVKETSNAGLPADTSLLTSDLSLNGDPNVWADVLDSIGINMDRRWIETAFLTDNSRS